MTVWTGKLGEYLDNMGTLEQAELMRNLHSKRVPAEWLAEVMTKNGMPISASTIRTQRRAARRKGVL